MKTFEKQNEIPFLPVPELENTLSKYLETVRPFLTEKDYQRTLAIVDDFEDGVGKTLHERLLARKAECENFVGWKPQYLDSVPLDELLPELSASGKSGSPEIAATKSSWLIDWWNEFSYLRYRESIVLNVSFFFVFPLNYGSMTRKAASIVFHAEQFRQQLIKEELPPEQAKNGVMCMNQYKFLFNTCRVACQPSDKVLSFEPPKNDSVVFIRRNHYYVLKGVSKMSMDQIQEQVALILQDADGRESSVPVGMLTAGHRDEWSVNLRELYKVNSKNKEILKDVFSSSFIVCLDTATPITREEIAHLCWHGYGSNRWFDKTCQFIVFQNGRCGFLGEHSMVDATTPARLCDFVCSKMETESFLRDPVSHSKNNFKAEYLNFQLTDSLKKSITETKKKLLGQISKHDLQTLKYAKYGKGFVKTLGVSPDSYLQMAIQLAYFRLMGSFAATYESAGMKRFQWGRTETCRSVSNESVAFCRAMEDSSVTVEERAKLGKQAILAHSQYMSDCVKGEGIDRHFLGLRLSVKSSESMPSLFLDPAYTLSCHWTLSTSQIPTEYFQGYGWGQVVDDGFGIAYFYNGEDCFMFNVAGLVGDSVPDLEDSSSDSNPEKNGTSTHPVETSGNYSDDDERYFQSNYKKQRVHWLRSCLEEALDDMHTVFKQSANTENQKEQVKQGTASLPRRKSSDKIKKMQPLTTADTEESPPVVQSKERTPSIHSTQNIGLSLAYPSRSLPDLEGIVGEDVGFIEFEWGQASKNNRRGDGDSSSRRLVKLFRWPFNTSEKREI